MVRDFESYTNWFHLGEKCRLNSYSHDTLVRKKYFGKNLVYPKDYYRKKISKNNLKHPKDYTTKKIPKHPWDYFKNQKQIRTIISIFVVNDRFF